MCVYNACSRLRSFGFFEHVAGVQRDSGSSWKGCSSLNFEASMW